MINFIIRRSASFGIVGASILSLGLMNLKALALPTETVVEKLNPVPVFTVADDQGAPLVASGEDQGKVAGVFISQKDANDFVTRLKDQNPDLGKKVRVVPVSLGEVYKLATENPEQKDLNFAYVPNEAAVSDAKTVEGASYEGGVPLFVAKGGEDNGYLTIEKDSQQVIPFFFEKSQLENMVTKFKDQKPELASSVNIEVVPLEGVIQTLQSSDDQTLAKIVLVPSTESLQFLQNSTANQQAPTNQQAPANQPAPAKK